MSQQISCFKCRKVFLPAGFGMHANSKTCNGIKIPKEKNVTRFFCPFCNNDFSLKSGMSRHAKYCIGNPNKIKGHNCGNQYTRAKSLGHPKPELSEQSKIKLRLSNSGNNSWWRRKNKNEVELSRIKLRESMKLAVEKYPESYNSSNRGRVKCIKVDEQNFHGQWEVDFYLWTKERGIKTERVNTSFTYIYESKEHQYFPDFFLPDNNLYVEVKGYKTEKDEAKWNQFPHKLVILQKKEIYKIKKNNFSLAELFSL